MINITNQGHAKQNHNKTRMANMQKTKNSMLTKMKRGNTPCTWQEMNQYSYFFKKKLRIQLTYNPTTPLIDKSKEIEMNIVKGYLHIMLLAALSIGNVWHHARYPSMDEKIKRCIHAVKL